MSTPENKVHRLNVVPPDVQKGTAPQPDVIRFMERMLDKAKSGEMQTVGLAWARQDGEPTEAFAVGERRSDFWIMAAGITALQNRLMLYVNSDEFSTDVTPREPS